MMGVYKYHRDLRLLVKTNHTPAYTNKNMLLNVLPNARKSKLDRYASFLKDIMPSDPRELEDMRRAKGSTVISEPRRAAVGNRHVPCTDNNLLFSIDIVHFTFILELDTSGNQIATRCSSGQYSAHSRRDKDVQVLAILVRNIESLGSNIQHSQPR